MLMNPMKVRVKRFNECEQNGLRFPFGYRLFRASQLLNAKTAMMTVEKINRKLFSEGTLFNKMFKRSVDV